MNLICDHSGPTQVVRLEREGWISAEADTGIPSTPGEMGSTYCSTETLGDGLALPRNPVRFMIRNRSGNAVRWEGVLQVQPE
jgi:hypothetical protein